MDEEYYNYWTDDYQDGDWTQVRYRRGKQRFVQQPRRQRFRDNSQYPQRPQWRSESQRGPRRHDSYAAAVRSRPAGPWQPNRYYGRDYDDRPFQPRAPRDTRRWEKNQGRYRQQYGNKQQDPQRSDDPDFVAKVRVLHRLLKAAHHLKNVSDADRNPPAIQRITAHLATVIKPASPTNKTLTLIDGNARSWAYNTVLILKQHYQDEMDTEKDILKAYGGDLLAPLEIAAKWTRRNLGKRFHSQTFQEVRSYLLSCNNSGMTARVTLEPDPVQDPPTGSPPPLGRSTRATDTREISTTTEAPPFNPARTTPPPSPPPSQTGVSIATMTEPMTTSWSPPHTAPTPGPGPEPQPQRIRREATTQQDNKIQKMPAPIQVLAQ
ncbi:uncharacterized protein [Nothobranchius furzeri]|uniref:uncharacterized protein n=1 Tax=Nothobranchius furzeri TaxID=105023 RepID=UPI003904ADCB